MAEEDTRQITYDNVPIKIEVLGKKLNNFIQAIERRHNQFETSWDPVSGIPYF